MPKNKNQKEELVGFYSEKIKGSKAVYIINSQGLTANESNTLKKDLYDLNSTYNVVKNTLFEKAIADLGLEKPKDMDKGQHGIVFTDEANLSNAAKKIKELLKDKDSLNIVGGYLDSKVLSRMEVEEIAELPSYEQMVGKFLGTLNAPISGFVNVMAGNIRGLVTVLNAISEKKA